MWTPALRSGDKKTLCSEACEERQRPTRNRVELVPAGDQVLLGSLVGIQREAESTAIGNQCCNLMRGKSFDFQAATTRKDTAGCRNNKDVFPPSPGGQKRKILFPQLVDGCSPPRPSYGLYSMSPCQDVLFNRYQFGEGAFLMNSL